MTNEKLPTIQEKYESFDEKSESSLGEIYLNESPTSGKKTNRLVAAIDFGTTYSGYAFAFENDYTGEEDPQKSIHANEWRSSTGVSTNNKTLTTVLFDPDGNFHSFGYDAENNYAEIVENEEKDHTKWYCFKRFKMKLHDQMKLKRGFELEDENGHIMPAKKIFSASIKFLKDDLRKTLEARNPGFGDPSLWVLTVPAIWDEPAKQFMRECAEEAGLGNNMILALEPESAAIYCKTLSNGSFVGSSDQDINNCFMPGGMYMVLDLGGVFPWNCTHTIEDFKELDLYCSIRKDQKWGISDFRTWLSEHFRNSSVNLNDIGVNLYLNCHDSAAISLNRPIKVKGLRKLIIEGCTTLKYMVYDLSDDMYKEEDKLEVFEIVNSVHKIHVRELITLYEKEIDQKINSMYPCEHNRNLVRFVERNVSEELFGQRDLTSSEVKKLQENFQHSLYVRNTCEYSRLVYYEQSNSRQSSKNTFNAIKYLMNNSKFPVLRVFNFTNLGLTDIPSAFYKRDWWIYFKHLETLDFSNNRISTMDFEYSPFISKRTIHVNLRNNSFKIFTEEDIEKLKSFYPNTVDFRGNAFVCICENKALFSFIENNDNFGLKSSYEYLRNLKCADDKNKMKRLIDISISEICSTANQVTVNSISLVIYVSLSVFLTLIVVIVMFRFRHEIKILAHNRLKFERRMTTDNYLLKEFDAFVSYSSLDETWVVQSLCKRLESSPTHFKLCIHHKDFVPGACISDNIIQSVEKSRHTILVLSENFLKSEWCLLEFQKAFHQTLIERNRHLIIILLESVSEATLPVDMKHFLHTHTYINFTEPVFWDKLIYSLSERKRRYCCGMSMNTQAISQKHTTVGLK